MIFRATLSFARKEFDVLDCTYSLKRDVDSKGRPSSNIYGGQIRVHVESTDGTSILENMTNQFKPHSGSITFKKGDEEVKMKELTWENGYITEFIDTIQLGKGIHYLGSETIPVYSTKEGLLNFYNKFKTKKSSVTKVKEMMNVA